MSMGSGVLFIGGKAPREAPVLRCDRDELLLLAADSGLHHADRYGIEPDLILGDFDSIDPGSLHADYSHVPREVHPAAKDLTDTELGLHYLWERGVETITMIGGGGGRLDHLLGIYTLFDRFRYPRQWLTDGAEVVVIDEFTEFPVQSGDTVSFFPAGPDTCRMKTDGLRWNLDGLEWRKGDAGISNEFIESVCRVEVLSGRLLMVRALRSPVSLPWTAV